MKYLMLAMIIAASPAFAASNYLGGMSGMILAPDHVIVPHASLELSFHESVRAVQSENLYATGANYGLAKNLEAGISVVNNKGATDIAVNGKYRIVGENESSPAVLVGVFDAAGIADIVNRNASLYILASKSITPEVSQIEGAPAGPIRLGLGIGSGVYNGIFGEVDWTPSDRWRVMAEYVNGKFGDEEKLLNVGIRYAVADKWRLDAAVLKFKHFAFGANYRMEIE